MTIYVKKPNEVDALQFDGGTSIAHLLQWINSFQEARGMAFATSDGVTLVIPTTTVPLVANLSDWVVIDNVNLSIKTNANFTANYEIKE